ncbi:MAG: hypothetical protein J6Z13_04155, partial [Clostridia bacterium]|nr:hypothetical protein [Clostridia bacterium]
SILTLLAGAVTLIVVKLHTPSLFLTFGAVLLVIWRHRGNIERLVAGTEKKFSFRKKKPAPAPEAPPETDDKEPTEVGEEIK